MNGKYTIGASTDYPEGELKEVNIQTPLLMF
jgi:hypothetical protein